METTRCIVIMVAAFFVGVLPAAQARAQLSCGTEEERKAEVQKLNEEVDWFLRIVEEVPEGIAQQFRAARAYDEKVFPQATTHPLWYAYQVRRHGEDIKQSLRIWSYDMPQHRANAAIVALQKSAAFSVALSDYVDHDRQRRIINVQDWAYRYTVLPPHLALYAMCLVNLIPSGTNAAPR
jgi:hypothetical protein